MRCRSLRGGRRINVLYLQCWPEALCIEWSGSVPQLHGPSEHAAVSVPVFVSASVPGGGVRVVHWYTYLLLYMFMGAQLFFIHRLDTLAMSVPRLAQRAQRGHSAALFRPPRAARASRASRARLWQRGAPTPASNALQENMQHLPAAPSALRVRQDHFRKMRPQIAQCVQ